MALAREHVAALAALQTAAACEEDLPRLAPPALAQLVPGDEHAIWLCDEQRRWTDGQEGVAIAPLELGGSRLGALAVRREGRPFAQDELDLLSLAAGTLALTLVAVGSRDDGRRAVEQLALVADGACRIARAPLVTILLAEAGATRIATSTGAEAPLLLDLAGRPLASLLDVFEPGPLAGARPFLQLSLPGLLGALAPRRSGLASRARAAGLHGALICPIAVPSGVVGALVVALGDGPLDPALVPPLASLAAHAGTLVARGDEGSTDTARRAAGLALAGALAERDPTAATAARVVSGLSADVARELGLDDGTCEEAWLAGLLHDIGRLALPDRILRERALHTPSERALLQEAPAIAERILRAVPALEGVATAVRATRERMDGDGHPDGLAGDAIPIVSRIVAACEAWRTAPVAEEARERVEAAAGPVLDATVVEALCSVLDEHAWRVLRRAS